MNEKKIFGFEKICTSEWNNKYLQMRVSQFHSGLDIYIYIDICIDKYISIYISNPEWNIYIYIYIYY